MPADPIALDEAIELLRQAQEKIADSMKGLSPNDPTHHLVDGYDVHMLNHGSINGMIIRVERMSKAAKLRAEKPLWREGTDDPSF